MKCRKCGAELPDLTMYCTVCGAPQFEPEKKDITLTIPDAMNSKVIINSCSNMTTALTQIRGLTGLPLADIRKMLQSFPAVLFSNLSADEADNTAGMLKEAGIDAEAVHPETEKKEEPKPEEPAETAPEVPAEPEVKEEPEQQEPEITVPEEEPSIELTMEPSIVPDKPEEPQEHVPVLTLEPSLTTSDDAFMKEMEEFLNRKD
ncbi:MAG: hypothetical protein IKG15_02320 [Solobacterium sp.]|nr:hypothetical protein [Solobacterium sp.]